MKNQRLDYELLAESLKDRQLVAADAIEHILHQVHSTGVLFTALLVSEGLISDYELSRVACDIFALPFLPVDHYQPDKQLLGLFDSEFLRHYSLVPLDRRGKLITVAMPAMVSADVLSEVESLLQAKIVPVVGTVGGNQRWLEDHLPPPQVLQIGNEVEGGEWTSVLDLGDEAVQNQLDGTAELEASLGVLDIEEQVDNNSLRRAPNLESLDFELPDLGLLDQDFAA